MKTKILVMTAILAFVFSSCMDDDGYSLGDFRVSLGNVEKTDGDSYTVALDDGSVLYPSAGFTNGKWFENDQRILINYTILSDKSTSGEQKEHYVKVNDVDKVLAKKIIDMYEAIEDSIANDPIIIYDVWIGGNRWLNFELLFYGDYKTHMINLVQPQVAEDDENEAIQLELRHNSYGDSHRYRYYALVSFDLTSLQIESADEVKFVVKSKNYENEIKSFDGVYKYGNSNAESTMEKIGATEHFSKNDSPEGNYE